MSKKRAFVRYSKKGKIVPGSLILTSGSYPNGPSTWNEVPADLCCALTNGGCCDTPQEIIYILENDEPYDEGVSIQLNINCYSENPNDPRGGFSLFKELDTPLTTPPTFPEIIDLINQYFGSAGLTATLIDESSASVTTSNTAFFACLCVNGQREIRVEINSPA